MDADVIILLVGMLALIGGLWLIGRWLLALASLPRDEFE